MVIFYDGTGDEEDFSVENKNPLQLRRGLRLQVFLPLSARSKLESVGISTLVSSLLTGCRAS